MRLIDWVSPEGQEETGQKIKDTFKERLEGRKIAISLGPLLLLYWFPPWSLGPNPGGNPNSDFITESFSFVGIIKKKKDGTHIIGISFYRIIFRLLAALYVFALLILHFFLWEGIGELMFGLASFGLYGLIVCGIFERNAEDYMNRTLRTLLELDDTE